MITILWKKTLKRIKEQRTRCRIFRAYRGFHEWMSEPQHRTLSKRRISWDKMVLHDIPGSISPPSKRMSEKWLVSKYLQNVKTWTRYTKGQTEEVVQTLTVLDGRIRKRGKRSCRHCQDKKYTNTKAISKSHKGRITQKTLEKKHGKM